MNLFKDTKSPIGGGLPPLDQPIAGQGLPSDPNPFHSLTDAEITALQNVQPNIKPQSNSTNSTVFSKIKNGVSKTLFVVVGVVVVASIVGVYYFKKMKRKKM